MELKITKKETHTMPESRERKRVADSGYFGAASILEGTWRPPGVERMNSGRRSLRAA
jgi:hypothetical protein